MSPLRINLSANIGSEKDQKLSGFISILAPVCFIIATLLIRNETKDNRTLFLAFSILFVYVLIRLIHYYWIAPHLSKPCFIEFSESAVRACWKVPYPSEIFFAQIKQARGIDLGPIFSGEFEINYNEIRSIEIKLLQIILTLKSGEIKIFPLDNYIYDIIKPIKSKFAELQNLLSESKDN